MLVFMGILGLNNVQIEGLFFNILLGVVSAALIHYLVAKIIGPLLFGRLWCGWACWTAMVLDFLPFSKSPGRDEGRLGYVRYLHFVLSFAFVELALYLLGPWIGQEMTINALYWVLVGNIFYYVAAIAMAYKYQDNRAFCKYLCPITAILKTTSRFSLIKVKGNPDLCVECGACTKACPMDIDIPSYHREGKRVLSSECILCQTCINVCPQNALSLSTGIDVGLRDRLRLKREKKQQDDEFVIQSIVT